MRIVDFFDRGAELAPDRTCLTDGAQALSYAETRTLTHRIALALIAEGLGGDGRVAIYSPNHALAYASVLAVNRANAVWVPINARNAVEENTFILGNTETDWLIYHSSFADIVPRIRQDCPTIRGAVCLDRPAFDAWLAPHHGLAPDPAVDTNDLASLISSGGTTGRPKGVMLRHRQFETMIACFLACMPVDEPPVHLMVAPMTHAAGVTSFALLASAGTNVFMTETAPEKILQMIERHRVTHLFLPPTLIYVLLAHPGVRDYDYSSLKHLIYAAAPMSADKLREAWEVFGPVMTQTYGQAEAPMICTYMSPEDHRLAFEHGNGHRLLSCGRAAPFVRLEIMADDGTLKPRGEAGEIVVRGDLVMQGYYKNPQATSEAGRFGWHHTGDIGRIDEDGFVYIVDRKKDMIISGGFNVYPSEVEQAIWTHPAVQDCAVIGVPDEKWGEAVKAVVELKPDATVTAEEIVRLCKETVGSVKAPKSVEFWDTLPRSPVGKVLKRDIRARFWHGRDRLV